jgi:hypothetical protein
MFKEKGEIVLADFWQMYYSGKVSELLLAEPEYHPCSIS